MASVETNEEWSDIDPRVRAHRALSIALERMCRAAYAVELKRRGKPRRFRAGTPCGPGIDYVFTDGMRAVHAAQSAVLDGRITPEQAMALLHEHDVIKSRTNG